MKPTLIYVQTAEMLIAFFAPINLQHCPYFPKYLFSTYLLEQIIDEPYNVKIFFLLMICHQLAVGIDIYFRLLTIFVIA